jgi:hypothetical protein
MHGIKHRMLKNLNLDQNKELKDFLVSNYMLDILDGVKSRKKKEKHGKTNRK